MRLFASAIDWGAWAFTGGITTIDLLAASTNALNGALLARRPDHFKNWTVVGIILFAVIGGIGGGVTRDVLVNKVPSALTNPAYLTLAVLMGVVGYYLAYAKGQIFREGFFQFMTSFSLPWYAIVGAEVGVQAGLPIWGCLALAVIGPTAGRWLIDVSSDVSPKLFIRGEWFVAIAALTGLIWILLNSWGVDGWDGWAAYLIAFTIGFGLRLLALFGAWEEPLAKEPAAAYQQTEGRPRLGRKLRRESVREMHDLGLDVDDDTIDGKDPGRPGGG